jgi:uncharacterized protein (DUF111 family)
MMVETVGYAGDRDHRHAQRAPRAVGRAADRPQATASSSSVRNRRHEPPDFRVVMDRRARPARSRFLHAVQMKKNRPGTLLTVVASPDQKAVLSDVIFRETTTIGLRHYEVDRECLRREIVSVDTPVGAVRFKLAWRDGRVVNAVPEFDDCARIAAASNLSVKEVQAIAIQAYGARP